LIFEHRPTRGQTLEQQNVDRTACHEGRLSKPGMIRLLCLQPSKPAYQPELSPMLGVEWSLLLGARARGNAEVRRLHELYDAYQVSNSNDSAQPAYRVLGCFAVQLPTDLS
jgi:hypothetical protein